MSNKVKIIVPVIVVFFVSGALELYFFLQSLRVFWVSEGTIEKELTTEVMITNFHIDNEAKKSTFNEFTNDWSD
ncbi:hypothetical protein [uncultured Sunxiuqinia sp.]|uniref:hypothetical protein n=1 Tax=uncultured Sunxiuqinia sp. TaxID=1573825 RepID=UPI002AA84B81|nr:hypothetical protein [uncultured Sunxiuqinia sp.]